MGIAAFLPRGPLERVRGSTGWGSQGAKVLGRLGARAAILEPDAERPRQRRSGSQARFCSIRPTRCRLPSLDSPVAEWTWTVPAKVVRVVDGDRVIVTLDLGWRVYRNEERIGVAGIAAPEVRGEARPSGLAAKPHAETLLPVGSSVLINRRPSRPSSAPSGASRFRGPADFGDAMVDAGDARRV